MKHAHGTDSLMPEPGGPGGPLAPQYLADRSTLFQLGRADYPHLLLLVPPMFFPFRHHCLGNRRETRKDNDGFDLTFFKVIAADKHGAKVKIILGILGKQFT